MRLVGPDETKRARSCRWAAIVSAIVVMVALLVGVGAGQAAAAQVTLAWDANTEPDVSGYKIYRGTASGAYGAPTNVGNVNSFTVTGLADGTKYFFAMTAYDTFGNESGYSNEISYTTPGTATGPEINLVGNAVAIADGDTTPSAADFTDFGGAGVTGGTVSRTFTIQNTGTGALTLSGTPLVAISGTNAADFVVTSPPVSLVPAAGSTTFLVRFDPSAAGTRAATITIANNDANENPYNFTVQGAGTTDPEINLVGNAASIADDDTTPSAVDFTDFGGADVVDGSITRSFTIQNTGTVALTLSGTPPVSISGPNAADFVVTSPPVSLVPAAGSTTFLVRFDPSAAGARVATITIANSDANENPYNFSIMGTGAYPEIGLVGNKSSIVDGDTSPSTSDHTDFGRVDITIGTITRTFTIQNSGFAALTFSGTPPVAISGANAADFVVTKPPVSPVPAAGSTTFEVRFDPSATGVRTATITLANNDANENPYNFAIRGSGVTPEINLAGKKGAIPKGDSAPTATIGTDFGGADIAGGTATRTFTIKNTGSGPLSLSGTPPIALSGVNAGDFTVTTLQSSSVAAGKSATFLVRFDPNAPGTRVATITIASNDTDENPYDFSIVGTGTTAPEINLVGNGMSIVDGDTSPLTADLTDFGGADVATGAITRTFTVQNPGSEALTLTGTPLVVIGGKHAADFAVTRMPASSMAPAGSTTFEVRFDPSATGTRVAAITIANNDANENPYNFVIRGTGTTPEIGIVGNGANIADGDTLPSATDFTNFGGADVAVGTITRTFTIRNTGTGALTLPGSPRVAISGANAADFSVASLPGSPLPMAGSTTFQVRFDPSAAGMRVATISIANNDVSENPFDFAIQGTGTVVPVATAATAATVATVAETVSRPAAPSGPTSLQAGAAYTFSTKGAISRNGDPVQYRFSWSDGTSSDWLPVGVLEATKIWAAAGTYTAVQVQARCANHPSIISPVSASLTVTALPTAVSATETIARPGAPLGATSLPALATSVYRTGGTVSSSGDALQYRFLWSDGTMSGWLPVGVLEASKSWSVQGRYEVRTEARCALHPSVVSPTAPPLVVNITPGIDDLLSEPALPIGPGEGQTGFLYAFEALGASSSAGDTLQYRFQWGDGTTSDWVAADGAAQARASKFWPGEGIYSVTAEARCSVHTDLTISSAPVEVRIVRGNPELFFDTFAIGAAAGDTQWQVLAGGWAVTPDETFVTDSQRQENLAVVGTVPEFTAGRLTTRVKLAGDSTNYYAGIILSYSDVEHYRYVALKDSVLYVGQVGDTAAELEGVKASVQQSVEFDTWHQLRVDVHPGGEVRVYFGESELPSLTYRFADNPGGQVGCTANTPEFAFDDFGVWDERVLTP